MYKYFGNTPDNLNSFMLQIIDVQRFIKFAFTVLQKKTMVVMSLMMSKAQARKKTMSRRMNQKDLMLM